MHDPAPPSPSMMAPRTHRPDVCSPFMGRTGEEERDLAGGFQEPRPSPLRCDSSLSTNVWSPRALIVHYSCFCQQNPHSFLSSCILEQCAGVCHLVLF